MKLTDPLVLSPVKWKPRYESAPYRQHPSRREAIHGRVHEMRCKCGVCRNAA